MNTTTISAAEAAKLYPYINQTTRDITRTTEKFVAVPSLPIVQQLEQVGFSIYAINRDSSRNGDWHHDRHMISMVGPRDLSPGVRETAIIMNAANGTKSLQVAYGALRGACFNSCFFGDIIGDIRLVHKGDIVDTVPTAIEELLKKREAATSWITKLGKIQPNDLQLRQIASVVREIRPVFEGVPVHAIFRAKRASDVSADAWTVYNVAQEALIRGGWFPSYTKGKTKIRELKSTLSVKQANDKLSQSLSPILGIAA